MTNVRLPYIQHFKDRHGRARYYVRRPGQKRIALPGAPGSPEFMRAYHHALTQTGEHKDRRRSPAGSMAALIFAYYQSGAFKGCAISTQANHRRILERFRDRFGALPVALMTKGSVEKLLLELEDRPAARNHFLNCLRKLMKLAIRLELRSDDPTVNIQKLKYSEVGFHCWTDDEIRRFEMRWDFGTRARLALALLLYTAQRRSDVVRLGPQHIQLDGSIRLVQKKTKMEVEIPVDDDLATVFKHHAFTNLAFLVTAYGKPMTEAGFTQWFMTCVKDAGLPTKCKPHGLRKAACRRLAEAGCTVHEIMAITGHQTIAEVERYTKAADRKKLARDGIARLKRNATRT